MWISSVALGFIPLWCSPLSLVSLSNMLIVLTTSSSSAVVSLAILMMLTLMWLPQLLSLSPTKTDPVLAVSTCTCIIRPDVCNYKAAHLFIKRQELLFGLLNMLSKECSILMPALKLLISVSSISVSKKCWQNQETIFTVRIDAKLVIHLLVAGQFLKFVWSVITSITRNVLQVFSIPIKPILLKTHQK